MEDDLIHRHGIGDLIAGPADASPSEILDDPRIGRTIAHVQRVIEGESFEIRRTLRQFSSCLERQRRLVQERRQRLLTGADAPTVLREGDPGLFDKLVGEFGEGVVRTMERQMTLCHLDRCWSDHLAHVAEVREGIHLMSMGGFNALDEFNRQINGAFRDLSRRVDEEVLAPLRTFRNAVGGVDGNQEGLLGPSSTWTYMINDNPMGDVFARLTRGIKRLVSHQS